MKYIDCDILTILTVRVRCIFNIHLTRTHWSNFCNTHCYSTVIIFLTRCLHGFTHNIFFIYHNNVHPCNLKWFLNSPIKYIPFLILKSRNKSFEKAAMRFVKIKLYKNITRNHILRDTKFHVNWLFINTFIRWWKPSSNRDNLSITITVKLQIEYKTIFLNLISSSQD